MILFGSVLFLIAVVGLAGSTFGSSGLAWLLSRFSGSMGATQGSRMGPLRIDLMIAARDEEAQIIRTLESIERECVRIRQRTSSQLRVFVGADHCTDQTEALAHRWFRERGAAGGVMVNPGRPGKWNTLENLVAKSDADWVGLVDAGATWRKGLLVEALPFLLDEQVSGIAPSYRPASAGLLDRLTWGLERILKSIEAGAGGPVSVHGATVFYRRKSLADVYATLRREGPERSWLNDDVVLPLMMRIISPGRRIVYLHGKGRAWVRDHGVTAKRGAESVRRKRIVIGNLQWMRMLYRRSFAAGFILGLIASRRVLRAFWAYWALFGLVGSILITAGFYGIPPLVPISILVALGAISRMPTEGGLERLRAAFWAGLALPALWFVAETPNTEKIWN